jgi:D-amino-acid dehydrogenase
MRTLISGFADKGILMLFKTPKFEEEECHTAEKAVPLGPWMRNT